MISTNAFKILLLITAIYLVIAVLVFIVNLIAVIKYVIDMIMEKYFPKYYYYDWEDEEL